MSKRFVLEVNADFKPKLLRKRKDFMEHFLRMLAGDNEESEKRVLEYGVKVLGQRDNGDDMAVMINGERIYKG